eukprot:Gb_33740 [translate_table: standard]
MILRKNPSRSGKSEDINGCFRVNFMQSGKDLFILPSNFDLGRTLRISGQGHRYALVPTISFAVGRVPPAATLETRIRWTENRGQGQILSGIASNGIAKQE